MLPAWSSRLPCTAPDSKWKNFNAPGLLLNVVIFCLCGQVRLPEHVAARRGREPKVPSLKPACRDLPDCSRNFRVFGQIWTARFIRPTQLYLCSIWTAANSRLDLQPDRSEILTTQEQISQVCRLPCADKRIPPKLRSNTPDLNTLTRGLCTD